MFRQTLLDLNNADGPRNLAGFQNSCNSYLTDGCWVLSTPMSFDIRESRVSTGCATDKSHSFLLNREEKIIDFRVKLFLKPDPLYLKYIRI